MENIKVFEKHFRKGMAVKDFRAFKRTHPTLLKCILEAMGEVSSQADVVRQVKVPIKPKTADSINITAVGRLKSLDAELKGAIDGMVDSVYRVTACTAHIGYVKTPNGRKAKVTITVDANKDNW